jgi:ferredoxin-NADP reductase
VTAHGIPIGPLQFDRLEAAPAAKCTSRTQGNVGNTTEEVLMADQTAALIRREEVAEGTMAFHFEKPSGFSFRAGQFADVTLTDPLETDAKGNTRTFSIASAPSANELVFTTRMRNTAFKRSLEQVALTAEVKISSAAGSFTLHKSLAKPAIFLAGGIGITPFLSMVQQADRDRLSQELYLFYSNRRPEDAAFVDILKALETTNPNFRLICTMTEMSKSKKEWKGETALIDKEMLCRHLANLQGPIYYIAGPPTMVTAMRDTLVSAGAEENDIRTDEFVGY